MRKFLKLLLISAAILLTLTAVSLGLFLAQFEAEDYRENITSLIQQQTGREFEIGGEIELAVSLFPTLVLHDVTLGNPDWAETPFMVSVGQLEIQIALWPLLSGKIAAYRLVLLQPRVNLEGRAQGAGNWQFTPGGVTSEPTATSSKQRTTRIDIREVNIEQARIAYHTVDRKKSRIFRIERFTANTAGTDQALQIELEASYESLPLQLEGDIGSLNEWLAAGPYPVSLRLKVGEATGSIDGHIGNTADLADIKARIRLEANALTAFGEYFNGTMPPQGPLTMAGKLAAGPAGLEVTAFKSRLGTNQLAGRFSLDLTDNRPALTARLRSKRLDLTPFQDQESDDKQKDERIFSSEKFNLAMLRQYMADIRLEATSLTTRDLYFEDLNLQLQSAEAEWRLRARGLLADGNLDADITLKPLDASAMVSIRTDIKQLLPEKLPALQPDPLIRQGRTDIHFSGQGQGDSVAAIAAGFDGKLLVTIGKGRLMNNMTNLAGADILFSTFQLLNPRSERDDASRLECGVLNFRIKDGIAKAEDGIALQTAKVNVLGSGVVNLETEAIDFRAKPKARQGLGLNLAQLGDALHIGGTLANPKPLADLAGALKTAGTVGAAVATGGLSILAQGLFSRTFSTDDPCSVALGETDPGRGGDAASTSADSGQDSQNTDSDRNALKKTGDAVKGVFDGLFRQ